LFTKAIVKTPCTNFIKGITSASLGEPDHRLALKQHKAYVKALEQCGLDVIVLDPDENFPDSVFIEDVCLITPECAVITNPGPASRRDEILGIDSVISETGLPVEKITDPATLEAGDIMMAGKRYYVGISQRTNPEGAYQLESILKKYGYSVIQVPLESVLHLKTGISYLENNNLLACGEFLTKPQLEGFNILEVEADESYAANSVWINGKVLVPEGFAKTAMMIENAGYEVIEVDVSEFRKLDGGLSCLSLRF